MYFLETLQVCAPCHGGVLYNFWYLWNVVWICYEFFKYWKKNHFKIFVFNISCFLRVLSCFQDVKKKIGVKKCRGGGVDFFSRTNLKKRIDVHFFLISFSVICYFQQYKFIFLGNIEKCPFTYWLNGRWFLQIVDRDSVNLYPIHPLFPCSDFLSEMWGWFEGGGDNVFLAFYVISNISRNKWFWE